MANETSGVQAPVTDEVVNPEAANANEVINADDYKKTCKITLSIKFDLPPKEVYDTIKTAYEDGMAENFVSSLTARIPRQSLLDSLNQGLTKFYEGTSSSKNSENKSPEVQK